MTLAGTLNINVIGAFTPSVGNTFTILSYSSLSGDFSTVNGLNLPSGLVFSRTTGATSMTLTAASPLLSASLGSGGQNVITDSDLDRTVRAAIARWTSAGVSAESVALLQAANLSFADLPDAQLGLAFGNTVVIDVDAARHGWFIDVIPLSDEEFEFERGNLRLASDDSNEGVDLLTVVMHELGHVMGLDDTMLDTLVGGRLASGVRRLPSIDEVDLAFAELIDAQRS